MSVNVTIAGSTYAFPTDGEENWGNTVTQWAIAVSSQLLQRTGGNFTLTNDVNFGASFATIQAYLKSRTANISTAEFIRMARTDSIAWRNAANSANLLLSVNGSDQLTFDGAVLLTTLGVLTGNRALISSSGGDITVSTVTNTELGYVGGVTSAIQTQLNAKQNSLTLPLGADLGGTGVANNAAATLTRSGNHALTLTTTNTTGLTLPTTGTLATLSGTETFSAKTLNGARLTNTFGSGATYVALTTDYFIRVNSASTSQVTLPSPGANPGLTYVIMKQDNNFSATTITDGSFTTTVNTVGESVTVVANAGAWQLFSRYIPSTWVSYVPTCVNFGTVTVDQARWRRVGQNCEISVKITTGTVVASIASISLPSTLAWDYSVATVPDGNVGSDLTGISLSPLLDTDTDQVKFGSTTLGAFDALNGTDIAASTSDFGLFASVKISGWNG